MLQPFKKQVTVIGNPTIEMRFGTGGFEFFRLKRCCETISLKKRLVCLARKLPHLYL